MTSICGLGQIAPVPIASVIKHFPEEVDDHLKQSSLPGGICFPARDGMSENPQQRPPPADQLTIDGTCRAIELPARGTTIFDAARLNGIAIPTLCHQQNQNPVGVCRICVVDFGERAYAGRLHPLVEPGMKVQTALDRTSWPPAKLSRAAARGPSVALHPPATIGDCELERIGQRRPASWNRACSASR